MAKEFFFATHTHCTVKHPKDSGKDRWEQEAWRGTFPIMLHAGTQVWIGGSYAMEGHAEVKRVGDGRSKGYDEHGCCILSVPAEWCSYYTEEEAAGIEACIDADDQIG